MNDDFWETLTGAFVLGALLLLVILTIAFAAIALPFVGLGAVLLGGTYMYYHSEGYKEKKARERTLELYEEAKKLAAPDREAFVRSVYEVLGSAQLAECAGQLYDLEGFYTPPPPPPKCNSLDAARYRDQLSNFITKTHDPGAFDRFTDVIGTAFAPLATSEEGVFEVSVPLTGSEIQELIFAFFSDETLFRGLRKQLDKNLDAQKNLLPADYEKDDVAVQYLKHTPLLGIAYRTTHISLGNRFEHTLCLAQTGHGKTTLLEHLISKDLEEDCCVIVIDGQRQLIPKLAKLDTDVGWITPHHPLSLNPFQAAGDFNASVSLLRFVFASLMEAKLTTKQQVVFDFCIRLMLTIPRATVRTFLALLDDPKPFAEFVTLLDPVSQDFFKQYQDQQYRDTRREISWRVWALLKNPLFAEMFNSPENRVSMHEEMKRKLVLIDTDVDLLQDGSAFFGRLFIAMILREARKRLSGNARPVYLYLDEAHDIIDENIDTMLAQARKANIGVFMAHQYLDQIRDPQTTSGIITNTSTKFVGSVSQKDARVLAPEMHTTPEFLRSSKKGTFAAYIKGETDRAVSLRVPFGSIDKLPMVADMEVRKANMIARYSVPPEPEQSRQPEEPQPGTHQTKEVPPEDLDHIDI